MTKPTISYFDNPTLNTVGAELIENYKGSAEHIKNAQTHVNKAIIRRWRSGKLLFDNYDLIIEVCESQRNFSEIIGITESMLSNDLRAYKALLSEGCNTEDDVLQRLYEKGLPTTTKVWERLPKLLNEPESYREPDRREKDEKRLEDLYEELEEIKNRNLNNNINYTADEIQQEIIEITKETLSQDPLNMEWENEHYLNYIRNYGFDILTKEPLSADEFAHPHHVDPYTGNAGGGIANKLPDCFTIPLKKDNHRDIHDGLVVYRPEDYQRALITVLTKYIITHVRQR